MTFTNLEAAPLKLPGVSDNAVKAETPPALPPVKPLRAAKLLLPSPIFRTLVSVAYAASPVANTTVLKSDEVPLRKIF